MDIYFKECTKQLKNAAFKKKVARNQQRIPTYLLYEDPLYITYLTF